MANVQRMKKGRPFVAVLLSAILLLMCATPLAASQKKKKKKNTTTEENSNTPVIPMTDQQQIDYLISEMLGAWQIGDVERMHKEFDDQVSVVNGGWAPPIIGWAKYAALYQQERSKMEKVRYDRMNTYIWVNGDTAWACYQWQFSAVVNGEPEGARGQTTLVLEKKDNRWLIVHDHSNVVEKAQVGAPVNNTPPAQVPPAQKPGM
jgi:ketosteroid isomerase-like protein